MSEYAGSSTPTVEAPSPFTGRRKTVPVSSLVGARLPGWAPYAAGAAAVAVALGLRWLLSWTGWGTAFWTAALLFVIGLTVWSFSVEGRRRAKDRFASTIALKFGEAGGSPVAIAALIAAGLFLFIITLAVNTAARIIIARRREFTA